MKMTTVKTALGGPNWPHLLAGTGSDPRLDYLSGLSSYGYGAALLLALLAGIWLPLLLDRFWPISRREVFLKGLGLVIFSILFLVAFRFFGSFYGLFLYVDVMIAFALAFAVSWVRTFVDATRKPEVKLTWE